MISPRTLLTFMLLAVSTGTAPAEGFRNPPPGAFGLARSGARAAHIDDATAAYHNPANLADLTESQAIVAPAFVYITVDYDSPGASVETSEPWKILPHLFFGTPVGEGNFAAGLAITSPYGLSHEWKKEGPFNNPLGWRYAAPYFTELRTINFTPAISAQLSDRLQAGLGFNLMWSDLTFRQFFPWAVLPTSAGTEPDGVAEATGSGVGYGATAGITLNLTERQRLAFTFRSPMDVDYDGDLEISNFPASAAALGASPESDFQTEVRYPTTLSLGYGIELTDTFRLGADVEWLQFSRFDSLPLNTGANAPLFPAALAQDWNDTFTVGAGGDWKFHPNWTLGASYQFYETPVPDKTFSPTIPDSDQHAFTAGLRFASGSHAAELAYGAVLYDDRTISNGGPFDGRYEIVVHLVSASYRFSF